VNEGSLVEMIAHLKSYVITVDLANDKRHTQLMWRHKTAIREGNGRTDSRLRELVLAAALKPVADSSQRLQISRVPWIDFDLLAQSPDEYVDRTWSHERSFFPDGIE
jgi:hypothetical protein